MPFMPVSLNSAASLNYSIPIVSCLLFSMRNGRLTGPHDGFGMQIGNTKEDLLQREQCS